MTVDLNFVLSIAALVVSVVALLAAIPPLLQMVRGGPLIKIGFDMAAEQDAQFLLCRVFNLPIRSRVFRWLGVARSSTEIFAVFDIREHGTNKIVANSFRANLTDVRNHATGLVLTVRPPLPVIFTVVEHGTDGAFCASFAPGETQRLALAQGEYFVDVTLAWGEQTVRKVAHSFTVASNRFATHWTERKIADNW